MRFGIIGAGMIAGFHARAIAAMAGAELVAVYARRAEAATELTGQFGGTAYDDLDAFLAHDGLEVVTICTPSGAHLEPAIAAARAGKHIICEKPLEVTTERIDRMIAACRDAGVCLAGIFPRRFNPATDHFREAVAAGRFGRIALADAIIKWWRPQSYYDNGAWRGTWALDGGGALMNQSIHTVDLLLHIMGDVESVRAQTRLIAHEGIEVEDTATAMLTFKNGALGTVQGSTACWSAAGHPAEIQVCGEHGSVFMSDDRFKVWEFARESGADRRIRDSFGLDANAAGAGAADPSAIDFSWHQRNFEDVVEAIRAGRAPTIDGTEARRAVALIEAIYQSAKADGGRVDL
ncbi:MAG: Gfo/Idh/MocA family protein [Hyphomicrobiaceae bacterium]